MAYTRRDWTFVALAVHCPTCDRFIGRVGRYTYAGAPENPEGGWVHLYNGRTRRAADGARVVVARCTGRCPGDLKFRMERVTPILDKMWGPGVHKQVRLRL